MKLTIGKQLNIITLVVLLMMSISSVITIIYGNIPKRLAEQGRVDFLALATIAKDMRAALIEIEELLTDTSASRRSQSLDDALEEAETRATIFRENQVSLRKLFTERDAEKKIDELGLLNNDFDVYYATGKRMTNAYVNGDHSEGDRFKEEFNSLGTKITANIDTLLLGQIKNLNASMEAIKVAIDKNQRLGLIISFMTLLIVAAAVYTLTQRIRKAILNMYKTFREMAKEGDLTKRADMRKVNCSEIRKCNQTDCPEYGKKTSCWQTVGSNAPGEIYCQCLTSGKFKACIECHVAQGVLRDELDKMAAWFNTFVTKVSRITKDITHSAHTLSNSSHDLSSLSEQMSTGASKTSDQSNSVAIAAEEMSSNMHSMASAMEQTSTNISTVAAAIEQMTTTINEIARNSEKASVITGDAVSQASSASDRVDDLGNTAEEIGKVSETITDISAQINLLALNATIEAARAGEAGRGFTVVANEIKQLAKQTAKATLGIKEQIEGIQKSTAMTVAEIGQIGKVIDDVHGIVSTIATAVEEQSLTTKEIANNVAQAHQGIRQVNESVAHSSTMVGKIAKDISGVNEATINVSTGSSQVNVSAAELSKMAGQLKQMAGQFKL